jgi:quercetin dioxygenase-like cupin family protein
VTDDGAEGDGVIESRACASGDNEIRAEVELPCAELPTTMAFFMERLGFRLDSIFPADAPRVASLSGHGLRLRLDVDSRGAPGVLRLRCADPDAVAVAVAVAVAGGARELTAPNGTRIRLEEADPAVVLPPLTPAFVVSRAGEPDAWGTGRAGMAYRDVLPGRLGGRFVSSHIAIPGGGPVPDQVHFHSVAFQLIYCLTGWVRLVYEDQGEPFVLAAGDCVLQPPRIRHRVLEASPGLEVLEAGSPAIHDTHLDHELALPTDRVDAARRFGGQRFHRHELASARWEPAPEPGFGVRDLGLAEASAGAVHARVLRALGRGSVPPSTHAAELKLGFVLSGAATLSCEGEGEHSLGPGDGWAVPSGREHGLRADDAELSWLEVTAPASPGPASTAP